MGKRKLYNTTNTTLDPELTNRLRILAAQLGKRQNDLIEEAIKDLLGKIKTKNPTKDTSNLSKVFKAIKKL